MKYKALYKVYYNNKREYQELYDGRFNSDDAVKLGLDISGNEAFYCPCLEMFSLMNEILRVDKKVSVLKESLPKEAIHHFRMESLIDEIVITNNIEGVHSTRREIKDVLDSMGSSQRKEKRFEGLINQYILLGKDDIRLNGSEDVRVLYDKLVLKEVVEADPDNAPDGKIFRTDSVTVLSPSQKEIHVGLIPESKIIEYMQKSLKILNNDEIDILIRTAVFHYLFGYIHPFYDGNGRLSRFISSYYLSKDLDSLVGNRLSYTIQDNINEYYNHFDICNDPINKGDLTPFIMMFLDIVLKAENNLLYALSKRRELYEKNFLYILALSQREAWDDTTTDLCHTLLISSLFSRNGLNRKEILSHLQIKSLNTLANRLAILKEYGIIIENKDGNSIYYKLDFERLEKV